MSKFDNKEIKVIGVDEVVPVYSREAVITILNRIRAEIEQLSPYNKFTGASYPAYEFKSDVLQIIDKYKAESEDT